MTITWTTETRKLSQLTAWTRNPRQIKGEQVKRLQESVEEFGQFDTIAIGPGDEVYNGHQRLKSWGAKFGPDYEVEVRVSSRPLTEKEREKLTILAHKGAAGEWNFDTLANEFEVGELLEWGFQPFEIGINDVIGVDADNIDQTRQNNNMSIIGKGAAVGLNFGDIMVTIPTELYDRVWQYVSLPDWENKRDGIVDVLERGLNA